MRTKRKKSSDKAAVAGRDRLFVELYEWIESLVMTAVVVVLVFTFLTRTSVVSGHSMDNTLHEGNLLIVSRLFYTPRQGDIVVVTKPTGYDPLVKRVIATGGQSVDIDFGAGRVKVDGVELEEPYVREPTHLQYDVKFPVVVPEGELFVMGDNRNNSLDSRSTTIGFIDERYILGRVYFRILPLNAFGKL